MKLRTRIFLSFFIIILVPVILTVILLFGIVVFQARRISFEYGVDVNNLPGEIKVLLLDIIFCMLVILIITAVILSLWIYSGVSIPLDHLTRAAREIRDGNLEYELKPEGVSEIRDLCRMFEEMRIQLKAANEEKVEVDRQNRELISNISHDLKTPITTVKGYVEGIMDGVADTPEKMDRYIRTIYNKSIEMDRLINELTFYSKINTNRIPYNFNKVSVRGYFDDAAEDLENELTAKNVAFSYLNEVSPSVQVIADVEQIRRVINNIIGNSVKYMDKPDKKIRLSVRDTGSEIEASIEDNGKGIAARDLANVFDRFYRADSSRSSGKGGSGIGLSIVKKIIEDHGGRVWATSQEGEGTQMHFALRKYEEPVDTVSAPSRSVDRKTAKKKGTKKQKGGRS
ncbi:MAG: HAMP domain-containing histidine kinase [Lachnospiraceae bacterium]|nr:HAMP domain-containing histidine kinase [Lachnospiraceae bacterium]